MTTFKLPDADFIRPCIHHPPSAAYFAWPGKLVLALDPCPHIQNLLTKYNHKKVTCGHTTRGISGNRAETGKRAEEKAIVLYIENTPEIAIGICSTKIKAVPVALSVRGSQPTAGKLQRNSRL